MESSGVHLYNSLDGYANDERGLIILHPKCRRVDDRCDVSTVPVNPGLEHGSINYCFLFTH